MRNKHIIRCNDCGNVYDAACATLPATLVEEMSKHRKQPGKRKSLITWICPACNAKPTSKGSNFSDDMLEALVEKSTSKFEAMVESAFRRLIAEHHGPKLNADCQAKLDEVQRRNDEHFIKLNDLESAVTCLIQQNEAIEESIARNTETLLKMEAIQALTEDHHTKLDEMKELVTDLSQQNETFRQTIVSRPRTPTAEGGRVANMQQRSNNLMCYGIPNGDERELNDIVNKICAKFDIKFCVDTVTCMRLKHAQGTSPPVLIKFTKKAFRDAVFFPYIKKRELILSDVLDCGGLTSRIYLNEHLSKEQGEVIKQCRSLKEDKKIHRFFLRDGDIYIGLSENRKLRSGPIIDVAQLNSILTKQ